jgi:hypothetical protein
MSASKTVDNSQVDSISIELSERDQRAFVEAALLNPRSRTMPFDELPQRTWEGNKRLACRVIASVSFSATN